MVAAADQTAGQSAGTSTGPHAGWMMEEEPRQLSGSGLEMKTQHESHYQNLIRSNFINETMKKCKNIKQVKLTSFPLALIRFLAIDSSPLVLYMC